MTIYWLKHVVTVYTSYPIQTDTANVNITAVSTEIETCNHLHRGRRSCITSFPTKYFCNLHYIL